MQGERLRCKTIQVSIEHQREVASLGAARTRHERALGEAREREVRFWREVTSSQLGQPSFGGSKVGSGLHRALDAHRKAREARATLSLATRQVEQVIGRVARSKVALSTFEKMRGAELSQRARKIEEGWGEAVSELAVARISLRSRVGHRDEGGCSSGDGVTRSAPLGTPEPTLAGRPGSPNEVSSPQRGCGNSDTPPARAFALVSGELLHETSAPCLLVTVRDAGGAEVRCQIRSEKEGAVGIALVSEHGGVVSALRQEKGALLSRLLAVGVSVKDLRVEGAAPRHLDNGTLSGFKRRRSEEFDESAIA